MAKTTLFSLTSTVKGKITFTLYYRAVTPLTEEQLHNLSVYINTDESIDPLVIEVEQVLGNNLDTINIIDADSIFINHPKERNLLWSPIYAIKAKLIEYVESHKMI